MGSRPLLGKLALFAVPLIVTLAHVTGARAADDEAAREEAAPAINAPDNATSETPTSEKPSREDAPREPAAPAQPADGERPPGGAGYYPPVVDGPALRLPESLTHVYADGAYAISNDLTALPYIAGRGRNFRGAVGGAWRWRRLALDGQLIFNVTTIDVSSVLNQAPRPEDEHQTKPSLGDLTLGATWTERITDGEGLIAGLGVRGRLPTHTTRFEFHLNDGSIAQFVIPYYFHIEPTLILGGAIGPLTYVMNQGAIILLGPDANFDTEHITVPTIYLYDAHYAVGVAPWSFLGASVEVATIIQLNHVAGIDFQKFNDIRAVWVAPALQIHVDDVRIDLIARLGASRGQELYGVLEYVGTSSFTVRVTRQWN
jgi:hypothetical protein